MSAALPPPLTDEEWSETDVKLPGDDGFPWWHGSSLAERFGPSTRAGSTFNVVVCGLIVSAFIANGFAPDALNLVPLLGMEAVFIGIAVRAWWLRI